MHYQRLLQDAMARRARERGKYSYADLERDIEECSGKHKFEKGHRSHSHARNVIAGHKVRPTRDVLLDLAMVLGVDPDEVLIGAGYAPQALMDALERHWRERPQASGRERLQAAYRELGAGHEVEGSMRGTDHNESAPGVDVVFDGVALRPIHPLDLQPSTRYRVKFIEVSGERHGVLDDILDLAQDLGIEDLAEQHDHYLYGTPKR